MKKGIIVLLIAVLVAGFAFAGFSGNAKITLGADLDAKTFGFGNWATGKYTFSFTYDTLAAGKDAHETDLWAEIAAEGTVKASATAEVKKDTPVDKLSTIKGSADGKISAEFKITKANIHVGEWTFGILNAGAAVNYAKSYYTDDDGNAINNVVGGEALVVPGFTVAYKDWRGGFGLKGNWAGESLVYNVFAHGETKEFKFGENEEFKLQAGAYVHYYNEVLTGAYPKNVGGAAKVGYEKDAFSADAAVDLQMVLASEKEFKFEADANATYKFSDKGSVGLNVYGTNFIYLAMGEKDPIAVDTYEKYEATSYKGIKLDAKLWAKYDFDFDGTTLATEAHVEVKDALVDGREIVVFAKETLKVLDGKLALVFSEKYEFAESTLTVTAKATYTAEDEKFVAWVGVDSFAFSFADKAVSVLKISCGIKSAKIIENAEIGLTYGTLNLFGEKSNGTIKAYAKIAF
jgi:hypothetical protein